MKNDIKRYHQTAKVMMKVYNQPMNCPEFYVQVILNLMLQSNFVFVPLMTIF